MNRYAVVGFPVRHSLSPWIHGHFARQTQRQIVYAAFAPSDFATCAHNFFAAGGHGLNITAPFKKNAVQYASRISAFAMRADAANVLTAEEDGTISACNTDGAGLIKDLTQNCEMSLCGRRVLIAGAGGAARAAAIALAQRDAKIVVAARTSDAAATLAKLCDGEAATFRECGGGYDLIVNTVPGGQESPIPKESFSGATLGYDLNYGAAAVSFLRAAAAAKYRTDGGGMLIEQAALSFAVWQKIMPTTALLIQTLRKKHRHFWE